MLVLLSRIAYAFGVTTRTADVSSRRAAEIAGISYRQLDYWARLGYVEPSGASATGSGSRRRWTLPDVQRLASIAAVKEILGTNVEIEFVLAVVDGAPLDRPVVAGHTVPVSVIVDLEPVRQAVADAWPGRK